mmetsp:Transcript_9249/g.38033  ORF Transcript_9249/g.38033 Transcript_9249/m.38033 type:complete len:913 (+) Transcript_9249:141-2879(+)
MSNSSVELKTEWKRKDVKELEKPQIEVKTEWKRKDKVVQYFTTDVANADYFDLMKASAPSLKEKTVLDGFLTKQGGKGIKQCWRKRWFVLTYDKYLYYFKTQQDEEPTGVINLEDYEEVTPVEDAKRKYRFNVHNNNKTTLRVFRLFADNLKESLEWISAIGQVLKAPKLDNSRTKLIRRDANDVITAKGARRSARLYARIVEARKLPRSTSTYCILDCEDQQRRTQTVWKSREPMWSEDFYLDVYNPETAMVAVTCWRMEKGDVLGKVELPVSMMMDERQHEQWYPLAPADASQYIAGEVHLKIEYKPDESILLVQVVEARNLAPKGIGGTSNPYIKVQMGKKKKKTKTMNKTLQPVYNELFEFKLTSSSEKELVLVAWHKDKMNSQFLGKVTLPYTELEPSFLYDAWYTVTDNQGTEDVYDDEEDAPVFEPVKLADTKPAKSAAAAISTAAAPAPAASPQVDRAPKDELAPPIRWISGTLASHRSSTSIEAPPTTASSSSTVGLVDKRRGSSPALSRLIDSSAAASSSSNTTAAAAAAPAEEASASPRSESSSKLSSSQALSTNGEQAASKKMLGDVRIVFKYTEEIVFPLVEYDQLLELLMDEDMDVIYALGDVTTAKEDVGRTLSHIFESKGKALELIKGMTNREIDNTADPDVIFRANTLGTKTLDYFMKLAAMPYLKKTLQKLITDVFTQKKPCEVDPTRLEKTDDIAKNFANLLAYCEEFTSAILNSVDDCPHILRRVFHALQQKVVETYPAEQIEVVRYTAVSGFLFLRFFCPAVLGPKLFSLAKEHPDPKTARTLTLIAKTLQNLSNLCEFGYKEPYMADMNAFIQSNMDKMRQFLDKVASLPDIPRKEPSPDIDFGLEMATINRHLQNNIKEMREAQPDNEKIQKLEGVLKTLEDVRETYAS